MSLQTYDIRNSHEAYGFVLVDKPDTSHQRQLQPGDWVTLRSRGYGIVIAVNDPEMLILWSKSPDESAPAARRRIDIDRWITLDLLAACRSATSK